MEQVATNRKPASIASDIQNSTPAASPRVAPFTDVPVDSMFWTEIAWMKEAGLTHGGFYAHFASREDLIAAARRLPDLFDQFTDGGGHAGARAHWRQRLGGVPVQAA